MYKRFGWLRLEGLRSKLGGPAVGSVDVDLVGLSLKKSAPLVGGSASPFIDKGDGFTGEGERVRMFLSLVAYADENWIMVDAPQYCQCRYRMSDVYERLSYLLQEGWTPVPANTS